MISEQKMKEGIKLAYEAGLKDGFKYGAMAALNPVEPDHKKAVELGTYPKD